MCIVFTVFSLVPYSFFQVKALGKYKGMSKKKKDNAPMPAASAGLLRFFEEETEGIKIRPEFLMVFAVTLIVVSVLAKIFF